MRLIASLGLAFSLLPAMDAAARCRFQVTPEFYEHVLVPQGRGWFGDSDDHWDLAHPDVTIRGRTVKLLVSYVMTDALDPPYFVIFVDDCGRGRIRSGFQPWDVALKLRKPTPAERLSPSFVE